MHQLVLQGSSAITDISSFREYNNYFFHDHSIVKQNQK